MARTETRRRLALTFATTLALLLAGCTVQTPGQDADVQEDPDIEDEEGAEVKVVQEEGKLVYWVLPGPRELDPAVFGTPEAPETTGAQQIQAAEGPVREILDNVPFLVGVPLALRNVTEDGRYVVEAPTPFSDDGRIVNGSLDASFEDRQPYDTVGGAPTDTADRFEADITFTSPAGDEYRIETKATMQPPLPGSETGGGVFVNAWHHGKGGPGTPLMPRVYTYAASYALGDLFRNDEPVAENHVFHVMTTQTVRDGDYGLAMSADLPLPLNESIAGQAHHTHVVMFPIQVTEEGPRFQPVATGFTLPNNQTQPFLHIMYEQDTVEEGPFRSSSFYPTPETVTDTEDDDDDREEDDA